MKKCIYCDNLTEDRPHFESGCCGRGMCDECYDSLQGTDEQLQLDYCDDEKLLKRIEKAGWTKSGCGYVCYEHLDRLPKTLWEKITSLFIK